MAEEEFINPEDRWRAPSMLDFLSKKIGAYLLDDQKVPAEKQDYIFEEGIPKPRIKTENEDPYSLFGKWTGDPMAHIGEDQLTRSLFKLDPEASKFARFGENAKVFDSSVVKDEEIFTIADTKHGNDYQGILDAKFNQDIGNYADAYINLKDNKPADAKVFISKMREKLLVTNPDSGAVTYKFREGLLGDIHLDANGNFSDYWNIGLDPSESINPLSTDRATKNLQRMAIAPLTKPPRVNGSVKMWNDNTKEFYNELFKVHKTEDKLIQMMKDEDDAIMKMIESGDLFE